MKEALFMIAMLAVTQIAAGAEAPKAPAAACTAAEYRQLDFWIGDWDVFESDGVTKAAQVRVDKILDGCALHERYEDPTGLKGESFSIYDASRKTWHQTWVTNRGQLLTIEGRMEGGKLILAGADRTKNGEERLVRGTWEPVSGGVRESAMTSTDGGRTWKPWFDLLFRPRASSKDDEKTVAALDKEYQAAVRSNDVATMDRILADDFALVTGTGKTYDKKDLLEEARAKRATYERQEDSEQTVRVWGDMAIVTAKLWAKGTRGETAFDYSLWFSDVYVRKPNGWTYLFAQASLRLPKEP